MNLSEVQATISASAATSGVVSHIHGFNEVLTLLATVVAIVTGCWVLYDKIKLKRKERRDGKSGDTSKTTAKRRG